MAKKIFIDAGHGGSDPGAVKYAKEADLNIKVSNYMGQYLTDNYDCDVKVDTTADSINTVTARANKWEADLFVSNHFNAGGGDGYEALVYSLTNKALGAMFEKYVKAAGQNSRGVKYRPDLGVLRLTNMPAILNEGAFVDNKKDIQDWNSNSELKKLGEAYAKAAADWLNLPKKTAKKTETKNTEKDSFLVRVKISDLYIRTGAGTNYSNKGFIKPGTYTIVETKGDWGKLKSGAGWIYLGYTERV